MQRRWIFPAASDAASLSRLRHEADVPDFLAELLLKRGVADGISAEAYLKPRLRALSAPEQLPEMEAAVARAAAALLRVCLPGAFSASNLACSSSVAEVLDFACSVKIRQP